MITLSPSTPLAAAVIRSTMLVLLLVAVAGCETGQNNNVSPSYASNSRDNAEHDAFVRGADRPPTPRTLCAMAGMLVAQGKDEEATFVLRRTISEHPSYAPAYNALAEVHTRQDRLDLAIETVEAGLEQLPGNAVLLNNRGMIALFEKDYETATDYFQQAAEQRPDGRYQANMALGLAMQGLYDEALEAYRLAVSEGEAHFNVAVAAEARNDLEYAAESFERAETHNFRLPRDAPTHN
ncbi:MAG: tetratricopeptide repeat protein [Phycisphaeraceae bacterium]